MHLVGRLPNEGHQRLPAFFEIAAMRNCRKHEPEKRTNVRTSQRTVPNVSLRENRSQTPEDKRKRGVQTSQRTVPKGAFDSPEPGAKVAVISTSP